MGRFILDLLKDINATLLDCRWADDDLAQLTAAHFGVISSFESVRQDLATILKKDLGDTPPDLPVIESGP